MVWEDSMRRACLLAIVFGPTDWATNAGIIALKQIALWFPDTLEYVTDIFNHLKSMMPRHAYCCYRGVLCQCFCALPGRKKDQIMEYKEILRQEMA